MRRKKTTSGAPLYFLISTTSHTPTLWFLHEVTIWDHIYGGVPEHPACIGIKELEAWQRSSRWSFTWQPLQNPRDWVAQIPLNLGKAEIFETSYTEVARAYFKSTSALFSWSFSRKHNQEGMSGQPGRQPLMGLWEQRPVETKAQPK